MAQGDELADEVKTFIVTQLACFETPSGVAKAVKEAFTIEVTRQRVETYDPTKVAGKALSKEFRELFAEARKRYLADTAEIGIANQTYRLRMLDRLATKAEAMGNMGMALAIAEQAAKEMGGAFTNRRELTGANGKPIETEDKTPKATPAQVADELANIFGAAALADEAGEPPAEPQAGDQVLRKVPNRRRRKKSRAAKAR